MINTLQSLRGIFAIMIFLHHFAVGGKGLFEAGGPCGVGFFLMLSGFVMCAGYEDHSKLKFDKYYVKRIIRVYPLHLLCFVIYLLLNIFRLSELNFLDLLPNILLLQSWFPIKDVYFSGNAVSWCLSDLMFFYAVFPLLIKFIQQYAKCFYIVLALVVLIYLSTVKYIPQEFQHSVIYINPLVRLIDFALGVTLWQLWLKFSRLNTLLRLEQMSKLWISIIEFVPILFVSVVVIEYPNFPQILTYASYWWLPMMALIFVFKLFNNGGGYFTALLSSKPLVSFGNMSFSFYMIHTICLQIILGILKKLGLNINWIPLLIITLAITICAAWIIYEYFEKPISKKLIAKLNT